MDEQETELIKRLLKWYADGMIPEAAEYQAHVRTLAATIQPNQRFTKAEGSAIEEAIQCSCTEPEFQDVTIEFLAHWSTTVWLEEM